MTPLPLSLSQHFNLSTIVYIPGFIMLYAVPGRFTAQPAGGY